VNTDFGMIDQAAADDANIDLEKIKKYFKNVINENNFLRNYERIKASSTQQQDRQIKATQQERLMMEKRLGQISNAKQMFVKGITNMQVESLNTALHSSHSFTDHPRKQHQNLSKDQPQPNPYL
jgi:phosphoenolpyruvate carboxylase